MQDVWKWPTAHVREVCGVLQRMYNIQRVFKKETVSKPQESPVSNVSCLITFQTPLILTCQFLLY
jgi:hypothetical protein